MNPEDVSPSCDVANRRDERVLQLCGFSLTSLTPTAKVAQFLQSMNLYFTCGSAFPADACRTPLTASLANTRTSSSLSSSLRISSVKTDIISLHVLLAIRCYSKSLQWPLMHDGLIRSENQNLPYIEVSRVPSIPDRLKAPNSVDSWKLTSTPTFMLIASSGSSSGIKSVHVKSV